MVRSIYSKMAAQHKNPVPNAAIHNGLMVTSGILGKDQQTGRYYETPEQQIESVFTQLEFILQEAGATPQDVTKVDLYFCDKSHRPLVNTHWLRLWPDPAYRPARQAHESVQPEGCFIQLVAMAAVKSVVVN